MTADERKVALSSEFGRSFHISAAEHVTWIFWTHDIDEPTEILGHASAFILDCGSGPILVTAAHVFRKYNDDMKRLGKLYCQVANTRVNDLSSHLIACGNLESSFREPDRGPDIATFRLPPGAVERIGKKPIITPNGEWPSPPSPGEQVMFAGYPARERNLLGQSEICFGFHSGMSPVSSITDHQITLRFEREFWLDHHGTGLPPKGYGLGGISGGPLLVPDYRGGEWFWRLGGVVAQATEERRPEDVIFEMVVAHRAEYIQSDGTLARRL